MTSLHPTGGIGGHYPYPHAHPQFPLSLAPPSTPPALAQLLHQQHAQDKPMQRSVLHAALPSWLDDDIRAALADALTTDTQQQEEEKQQQQQPGEEELAASIARMAADVRTKKRQAMHQRPSSRHRSPRVRLPTAASIRSPLRQSLDDSFIRSSPPPRPRPSPASSHASVPAARGMSTSVGRAASTSSLRVRGAGSSAREGVGLTPQSMTGSTRKPSVGIRPSPSPSPASSISLSASPIRPPSSARRFPPSPHSSFSPQRPGFAARSRSRAALGRSASSTSEPSENLVSVPVEWFAEVELKLERMAEQLAQPSPAAVQAAKNAELQRVRFAMVVDKLGEMNRLHRQVLDEEHQQLHQRDLDARSNQVASLKHSRLQSELAATKAALATLQKERMEESKREQQARHNEREIIQRWAMEKETALEMLKQSSKQIESSLRESLNASETRVAELQTLLHKTEQQYQQELDTSKAEWQRSRTELLDRIHVLESESKQLSRDLSAKTEELHHAQRRADEATRNVVTFQTRIESLEQRLAHAEAESSRVKSMEEELRKRSEQQSINYAKEKEELDEMRKDIEEREHILTERERRIQETETRLEEARREERRKQRSMRRMALGAQSWSLSSSSSASDGLHRACAEDYDSAWASGPIDRQLLYIPPTMR